MHYAMKCNVLFSFSYACGTKKTFYKRSLIEHVVTNPYMITLLHSHRDETLGDALGLPNLVRILQPMGST